MHDRKLNATRVRQPSRRSVIGAITSAAAFGARVHPVAYSNYDYLSYHQWWLDQ